MVLVYILRIYYKFDMVKKLFFDLIKKEYKYYILCVWECFKSFLCLLVKIFEMLIVNFCGFC